MITLWQRIKTDTHSQPLALSLLSVPSTSNIKWCPKHPALLHHSTNVPNTQRFHISTMTQLCPECSTALQATSTTKKPSTSKKSIDHQQIKSPLWRLSPPAPNSKGVYALTSLPSTSLQRCLRKATWASTCRRVPVLGVHFCFYWWKMIPTKLIIYTLGSRSFLSIKIQIISTGFPLQIQNNFASPC